MMRTAGNRTRILFLGVLVLVVLGGSSILAFIVVSRPVKTPAGDAPPQPAGQESGWTLAFSDEFDGASLDPSRWADHSSAEADAGRGNKGNKQLEWNQAANCQLSAGELVMMAKRDSVTSPSGSHYDWTSCLLSSTPSFSFQHGFIEERAVLPAAKGFWPAFWAWQAPGVDKYVETDVYEFYSVNHREFRMSQHSGGEGSCSWKPGFDPTTDWHTYAAAIEPSGTTWYVDGVKVCHTGATSDGHTNIISNLAVDGENPPAATTSTATKRVDYIRAWTKD